jgi:hypothetical protein
MIVMALCFGVLQILSPDADGGSDSIFRMIYKDWWIEEKPLSEMYMGVYEHTYQGFKNG